MKRLLIAAVSAGALAGPAFAQSSVGVQVDEDELIPMYLVSSEELSGADVYWADGESAGIVTDFDREDGDVVSLLVHDLTRTDSIVGRYRITSDDIDGYRQEDRTIVLRLEADDLEY
ncbi:MAG: PRC-barrel domain-containing protein [Oceanicaulis sp.]